MSFLKTFIRNLVALAKKSLQSLNPWARTALIEKVILRQNMRIDMLETSLATLVLSHNKVINTLNTHTVNFNLLIEDSQHNEDSFFVFADNYSNNDDDFIN